MGYFISSELGYYEGDQISPSDIAVPRRPDGTHVWDGQAWQPSAATLNAPILAEITGLEASVTLRMWREDRIRSTVVDPRTGRTASQHIDWVDAEIEALRAQLQPAAD